MDTPSLIERCGLCAHVHNTEEFCEATVEVPAEMTSGEPYDATCYCDGTDR